MSTDIHRRSDEYQEGYDSGFHDAVLETEDKLKVQFENDSEEKIKQALAEQKADLEYTFSNHKANFIDKINSLQMTLQHITEERNHLRRELIRKSENETIPGTTTQNNGRRY